MCIKNAVNVEKFYNKLLITIIIYSQWIDIQETSAKKNDDIENVENNEEVSRKHISKTYVFGLFYPLIFQLFLKEEFNSYNRSYNPFRTSNYISSRMTKEEYLTLMKKMKIRQKQKYLRG